MSLRSGIAALVGLAMGAGVALAQAPAPATQPVEMIQLNIGENTKLKALIDYTSARLNIRFLYDDQVGQQVFSVAPGAKIPADSLLNFLQVILEKKGYTLADVPGQPGWMQIAPNAQLVMSSKPLVGAAATQPAEGAVTRVYVLKLLDTARLEAVLKPFLSAGGSLIAMNEYRLLIVTDSAANVDRVGKLLAAMDTPSREIVIDFYTLQHGEAQELATRIATIMHSSITVTGTPNPAQLGQVEVAGDPRTNQLSFVGPVERVQEAIRVAKQLDRPRDLKTVSYSFTYASPERVDKLMKQMYDAGYLKRNYSAGVDKEGRLLVVTGPPEIHARVEELRRTIDVAATEADSPIKFYKLSNTSAKDVLATLRSLQGEESGASYDPFERSDDNRGSANPIARRRANAASGYGGESMATSRRPRLTGRTSVGGAATRPAGVSEITDAGGGRSSFQTDNAIITADVNTNTIIVLAEPSVQRVYEQLIQQLDKRRPQVLIECTLVTLDTSRNFTFGVDIGATAGGGSSEVIMFSSFGVGVPQTVGGPGTAATGRLALVPGAAGFNGALLSPDIADIVVNALLTTSRAKVVSAPRILVNDNATGSLMSIAEQPYTNTNIGDTISTTSFGGYAEAGTTIDLTPHISEANYLQLEYEVSLNQFSGAGANGIPPPRQTNSLSSTVTIPDGSTIIIGGLDASNFSESRNTFPVLGEIPFLRWIFGTTNKNRNDSTLFVFIRPVILRDDRFQDLKYLSERDTKLAGLSPDDPVSEPIVIR